MIFHTDHKPEAHNNPRLKGWAQRNIPQIKSVKHDLEEFRKRDPNELKNSDVIAEARVLLNKLKNVVLDGMSCHLSSVPHISELQQIEEDITKIRRRTEESIRRTEESSKRIEKMLKEKEAAQEEIIHLRTELAKAKRKPQARPQPTVVRSRAALFRTKAKRKSQTRAQPTVAGTREALFHATTTSQDTEIAGTSQSVFPNR